jgi:hypothetical protein
MVRFNGLQSSAGIGGRLRSAMLVESVARAAGVCSSGNGQGVEPRRASGAGSGRRAEQRGRFRRSAIASARVGAANEQVWPSTPRTWLRDTIQPVSLKNFEYNLKI